MRFSLVLLAAFLVLVPLTESHAKPKRSDGGACDTTGTARKTGKDDQGNSLDCLWDTCTFTQCDTNGGTISNCVQKTNIPTRATAKRQQRAGSKARAPPARSKAFCNKCNSRTWHIGLS